MNSPSPFQNTTDASLRQQILTYSATEMMTDRERAAFLGLPEGCRIRERAKILCPEKLIIGKNVWIGEGAILDAQGGLTIGDETQIGLNSMIWTHSSHLQALYGETGTTRDHITYQTTSIGKNCFLAGPCVILAGVKIGDGVLIPPMSVISSDVPSGTILRDTASEFKRLHSKIEKLEKRLNDLLERPPVLP